MMLAAKFASLIAAMNMRAIESDSASSWLTSEISRSTLTYIGIAAYGP